MSFDKALAFTLRWEGGYVNHPADTLNIRVIDVYSQYEELAEIRV